MIFIPNDTSVNVVKHRDSVEVGNQYQYFSYFRDFSFQIIDFKVPHIVDYKKSL